MAKIELELSDTGLTKAIDGIKRLSSTRLRGRLTDVKDHPSNGKAVTVDITFPEQGEMTNLEYGRKCLATFLKECIRVNEEEKASNLYKIMMDALTKPIVEVPDDIVK